MSEQIEIAKYDQQYDDLKTSSPKTFAQNAVMTTNEVALFLDCSKQYIALLASTGKLSYLRNTDNGYLFYKYDIIEYKKTAAKTNIQKQKLPTSIKKRYIKKQNIRSEK